MNSNNMKVIARQTLSEDDLSAIRELESVCNDYEHLKLKLNWGMLSERKPDETSDFFCYDKEGSLAGYLAIYCFGNPEAEISGMVNPVCRRHGIFSGLLDRAMEECRSRHIKSLLFICERSSTSGMAFVESIRTEYDHSEHRMELSENARPAAADGAIRLRKATPLDFKMMTKLDALCFGMPDEDTVDFYSEGNLMSNAELYVAVLGDQAIGKIRLERENEDLMIYGFAIQPEYRGRGYGRTTLQLAVNIALEQKPARVGLEVDCINDTALSLYHSCGFQTISTYDYFRLPVQGE
jgi:ribosomal protein S18 acetylase RimI-like enzyme